MLGEKRFGMGPVPQALECYINERQVNGISILKKFGWKLVCVRRPAIDNVTTIVQNRLEGLVGILDEDGVLRINDSLKIRK
jgi:hypothetical protein